MSASRLDHLRVTNRVVFAGGQGDVSWSLDFEIRPTGADSNVPEWDAFYVSFNSIHSVL